MRARRAGAVGRLRVGDDKRQAVGPALGIGRRLGHARHVASTLLQGGAEEAEVRLCRAPRCRGRNRALELELGARVAAKDHHTALRSEVLGKINAFRPANQKRILAAPNSGSKPPTLINAKNPAARPGFVFVEAGAEECGLIFRDDRRRSVSFELVGEPGLHLVFLQATVRVEKTALGKHSTPIDSAEIREAVLGSDRPIVGEGIFDSAADRPAGAGVRTAS